MTSLLATHTLARPAIPVSQTEFAKTPYFSVHSFISSDAFNPSPGLRFSGDKTPDPNGTKREGWSGFLGWIWEKSGIPGLFSSPKKTPKKGEWSAILGNEFEPIRQAVYNRVTEFWANHVNEKPFEIVSGAYLEPKDFLDPGWKFGYRAQVRIGGIPYEVTGGGESIHTPTVVKLEDKASGAKVEWEYKRGLFSGPDLRVRIQEAHEPSPGFPPKEADFSNTLRWDGRLKILYRDYALAGLWSRVMPGYHNYLAPEPEET